MFRFRNKIVTSILLFSFTLLSFAPSAQVAQAQTDAIPLTFSSSYKSSVLQGQSVGFFWTAPSATSCTAGGDWSGAKEISGYEIVGPLISARVYSYSLTCTGPGGSISKSQTVGVTVPAGDRFHPVPFVPDLFRGQIAPPEISFPDFRRDYFKGNWTVSPSVYGDQATLLESTLTEQGAMKAYNSYLSSNRPVSFGYFQDQYLATTHLRIDEEGNSQSYTPSTDDVYDVWSKYAAKFPSSVLRYSSAGHGAIPSAPWEAPPPQTFSVPPTVEVSLNGGGNSATVPYEGKLESFSYVSRNAQSCEEKLSSVDYSRAVPLTRSYTDYGPIYIDQTWTITCYRGLDATDIASAPATVSITVTCPANKYKVGGTCSDDYPPYGYAIFDSNGTSYSFSPSPYFDSNSSHPITKTGYYADDKFLIDLTTYYDESGVSTEAGIVKHDTQFHYYVDYGTRNVRFVAVGNGGYSKDPVVVKKEYDDQASKAFYEADRPNHLVQITSLDTGLYGSRMALYQDDRDSKVYKHGIDNDGTGFSELVWVPGEGADALTNSIANLNAQASLDAQTLANWAADESGGLNPWTTILSIGLAFIGIPAVAATLSSTVTTFVSTAQTVMQVVGVAESIQNGNVGIGTLLSVAGYTDIVPVDVLRIASTVNSVVDCAQNPGAGCIGAASSLQGLISGRSTDTSGGSVGAEYNTGPLNTNTYDVDNTDIWNTPENTDNNTNIAENPEANVVVTVLDRIAESFQNVIETSLGVDTFVTDEGQTTDETGGQGQNADGTEQNADTDTSGPTADDVAANAPGAGNSTTAGPGGLPAGITQEPILDAQGLATGDKFINKDGNVFLIKNNESPGAPLVLVSPDGTQVPISTSVAGSVEQGTWLGTAREFSSDEYKTLKYFLLSDSIDAKSFNLTPVQGFDGDPSKQGVAIRLSNGGTRTISREAYNQFRDIGDDVLGITAIAREIETMTNGKLKLAPSSLFPGEAGRGWIDLGSMTLLADTDTPEILLSKLQAIKNKIAVFPSSFWNNDNVLPETIQTFNGPNEKAAGGGRTWKVFG